VRNLKISGVDDGVAVEDDIDIDGAGAVGDGAAAFELAFDAVDRVKELLGEERGFDFGYEVEEPGLGAVAVGFGFVDLGNAEDVDLAGFQKPEGLPEVV
jgi:hypothetical protein